MAERLSREGTFPAADSATGARSEGPYNAYARLRAENARLAARVDELERAVKSRQDALLERQRRLEYLHRENGRLFGELGRRAIARERDAEPAGGGASRCPPAGGLDSSLEAFALLDQDGFVTRTNPALAVILMRPVEGVLGAYFGAFVMPERMEAYREAVEGCRQRDATGRGLVLRRGDGSPVSCWVNASLRVGPDGEAEGILLNVADTTLQTVTLPLLREQKRATESRARETAELLAGMIETVLPSVTATRGELDRLLRDMPADEAGWRAALGMLRDEQERTMATMAELSSLISAASAPDALGDAGGIRL